MPDQLPVKPVAGRSLMKASTFAAVLASLSLSCGGSREQPSERGRVQIPPPGAAAADKPHVVFTDSKLYIDRLDERVGLPVTTPSRPSPATLENSSPEVITVTEDGGVVAHREGIATLRPKQDGAAALVVTVTTPSALEVRPNAVTLEGRGSTQLVVLDSSGREVPRSAVRWKTSDVTGVVVSDGRVTAFGKAGTYEIHASVGGAQVSARVEVKEDPAAELTVKPDKKTVRVGQVFVLHAYRGQRAAIATWSSSNAKAVSSAGQGIFEAKRRGRAQVCAHVDGRETCSQVEVKP
jgi:hypothetical protein